MILGTNTGIKVNLFLDGNKIEKSQEVVLFETRSRWRLKRLRSEPRICLTENQNKRKAPFLKITLSGTFSCNASL